MHWIIGYVNKDTGLPDGVRNEVLGVTLKDDPQKARGKRGPYILWEEMGKFPGLETAWLVAKPSVEQDSSVIF